MFKASFFKTVKHNNVVHNSCMVQLGGRERGKVYFHIRYKVEIYTRDESRLEKLIDGVINFVNHICDQFVFLLTSAEPEK